MAKTIQVQIASLGNYLAGKDNIVDVVLTALENFDLLIFLRARSERVKNSLIEEMSDMWDKAAVLAESDVSETDRTIKIVMGDIEHARTCLNLGGCTLYGRISYHWKLFRMYRQKLPLLDVLAWHIANHGNKAAEKEEILARMDQYIVTAGDFACKIEAFSVRNIAPKQCPAESLTADTAQYLVEICSYFRKRYRTSEQMLDAWAAMLEKKARQTDSSKWEGLLNPADALLVLFENLSYDEVRKHENLYLDSIV